MIKVACLPSIKAVAHRSVRVLIIHALLWAFSSTTQASGEEPLTIVFNENWPPYSYRDTDGEIRGILADIIRDVIGSRMNVPINIKAYPWARVQRNIEVGIQDGFVTTATNARLKFAERSQEIVYAMKEKPFISKNSPHYNTLKNLSPENIKDLNQFKVCDMLGNGWAKNFYAKHSLEVQYFKDINICFRNIAINRYDIVIHVDIAGQQQIKQENLQDKVVMLPTVMDEIPFPLLINKKSKYLSILPDFDIAIRQYREEGYIEKIIQKYTTK